MTVLGIVSTAGCAQQNLGPADDKRCTAARFEAPFAAIDPCSAEAVLTAALATMFTYTPATQSDQRATFRAATPLLEPEYATRGEAGATVVLTVTATTWQRWQTASVSLTAEVHVTGDDHPVDTDTVIHRVLALALQPSDSTPALAFTAYATARRVDRSRPWLLSALGVTG
ncbi:hypothetical protein [Nocardia sp. XZ_19_385]|uniref:hypothetical protein n=1 Tax=Nocardia sp. XZ_19_385 TaxID=2769488 RepID=UPI00188F67A9|nr:hypothetical protein [Nocardia sp. XZ_19_385]